MINQRLMKPGSWDLGLIPDTPKAVRDLLLPFGHIVIMESRLDPRIVADADIKAQALYIGIMRRRPTPFSIAGVGLVSWLGDEEDKGTLWEANLTLTARTFVQAVGDALKPPVVAGTLSAIGAGTVTQTFFIADGNGSTRKILDWLMIYFGGEYRVNNDATLDAGLSSALFATTPKVILLADDEGGRDSNIIGLHASTLNVEIDADSYTTRVWLAGAASSSGTANAPATSYKDLRGNTAVLTRFVSDTSVAAGNTATAAAAAVLLYPLRQTVTLRTDRFDVARDVQPGDSIYVYDPTNELIDTAATPVEVHYAGRTLNPIKLRVFAMSWPVETGMGVYYRDGAGVYTDLSPWIAWEQPGTDLEVGAPARPLTYAQSTT